MEMDVAFGPIAEFISDKTIEEIWINSPQRIFIARAGKSELTNLILSAEEVSQLVDRLLIWSGRRLDLSHPFVDARLPDGVVCMWLSQKLPLNTGRLTSENI